MKKKYGPGELGIADAVAELAEVSGRSSAQVGLNWVRQKATIPIIGTSKVSQIEDSLAALGGTLTEKEMQLRGE